MRAAVRAHGQGGKRLCGSLQATKATRPLTGRCGRYHEESVRSNREVRSLGLSLADREGRTTTELGSRNRQRIT